jgi:hypothetical protein
VLFHGSERVIALPVIAHPFEVQDALIWKETPKSWRPICPVPIEKLDDARWPQGKFIELHEDFVRVHNPVEMDKFQLYPLRFLTEVFKVPR